MRIISFIKVPTILAALTVSLTACWDAQFAFNAHGDATPQGDGQQAPPSDPTITICDPFSKGTFIDPKFGLSGEIHYFPNSVGAAAGFDASTQNYLKNGTLVPSILFLNQINVPTRAFSDGFETKAGILVKNDKDEPLFEYFSIHMKSSLVLAEDDTIGAYQLAVLSDDGAVLSYQPSKGANFESLVNNEGNHPTKLSVASKSLVMSRDSVIPINFDYFQGPRYHIAAILMWRKLASPDADLSEALNGQLGNSFWFDSTKTPSVASANYQSLLSRGWKPLQPANFLLQAGSYSNPCND